MKKLLICIFLFFVVYVNGQIINEKNVWNYFIQYWGVYLPGHNPPPDYHGEYVTFSYSIGKDTIIDSKKYSALNVTVYKTNYVNYFNSGIAGYLRDEDNHKKVYFIEGDSPSQNEYCLYDFNLKKDSIFNNGFCGYYKVTEIDTVEYFGIKRMRIKLSSSIDCGDYSKLEWIEGIGSLRDFQYNGILLCFKQNDTIMYQNNLGYDCIKTGILTEDNEIQYYGIKIYPNPSKDKVFKVESSSIISFIKIYDLNGINLIDYYPNSNSYEFKLTNFKSGIYFINVDNIMKKVIIE